MSDDVIEGDATELEPYRHPAPAALAVAPEAQAGDLVRRLDVIKGAMQQAMTPDIDYGVIPGTGSKPTLLKPGAEKLAALFQLDVQVVNDKTWHDDGHLTVVSKATVFHQPTGIRLGSGEGICSTRENRYAFRNADRVCPMCGKAAIIKGRDEYGGGWVCFKKKDGCGAKFSDGDQAIEGQAAGKVANENLADVYNTVCKIGSKRARVDAVLAVTGASAVFTQDIEDFAPAETTGTTEASHAPSADGTWRWPSGKHAGATLAETPADYLEWYSANGPKADVRQMCLDHLAPVAEDDDIPF